MTTLSATYQPASGVAPPSVLLQVAAAPSITPAYASNFATVDGWVATQSGVLTLTTATTGTPAARMVSRPDQSSTFTRQITGLTAGATYEATLYYVTNTGRVQLGVSGIGAGTSVYSPTRASLKYTFVPVGTTNVTLTVTAHPFPTIDVDYGDVVIDTVVVRRVGTWLGTTIRRTDANGTDVPVRTPVGLDAAGTSGSATMTVTDYEAALVGAVEYAVTDGNGAVAFASLYGTETNLVLNPTVDSPTGGGTANWAPTGSGTSTGRTLGQGTTGVACLNLTTGTTATSGAAATVLGITAGRTYGARLQVLPPVTSDLRILIQWLDAGGAQITTTSATVTASPAGVWATLGVTGVAPALCTQAKLYFQRVNDSTAGVGPFYIDAALMTEVATAAAYDPAAYWDGSLPTAWWTGTAHASASTRATGTAPAGAGVWVSLPSTASAPGVPTSVDVDLVTGLSESSTSGGTVHRVVGRADPLVNAGPLSTRAGNLDAFAPDYATADSLRALLASGAVALLRQPTYPGLDLYFVATSVDVTPETPSPTQRWKASIAYVEVVAP